MEQVAPGYLYQFIDRTDDRELIFKLNGKRIPANVDRNGYVTIDTIWNKGYVIETEFPMKVTSFDSKGRIKTRQ